MKKVILAAVAVAVLAGGYYTYDAVLGPTDPPSGPMTAEPISFDFTSPAQASTAPSATELPSVPAAVTENVASVPAKVAEPQLAAAASGSLGQMLDNVVPQNRLAGGAGFGRGFAQAEASKLVPEPIVLAAAAGTDAAAPAAAAPAAGAPAAGAPAATKPADKPSSGTAAVPANLKIFQITPDTAEARFTLNEELRGAPKEVIGKTKDVAGEIAIDAAKLENSKLGVFKVNARTIETDDQRRNQAMRNRILMTNAHEFIVFTPKAIKELKGEAKAGNKAAFKIEGDLTIGETTKPVVFDATLETVSATEHKVHAVTTVKRADFGLVIPSVPMVANVTEDVKLEIEGKAVPKP